MRSSFIYYDAFSVDVELRYLLAHAVLKMCPFLIHRASIRNIVSQKKQTKKQKATYGYLRSFLVPEDVIYPVLVNERFP